MIQAVNHLKNLNGVGILLTPEWKSDAFYPFLNSTTISKYVVKKLYSNGENVFIVGADKSSYFGLKFKCRVIIWHLNLKDFIAGAVTSFSH